MTGLLVVFSGLDGSGKSTQIESLLNCLANNNQKTVYLWARGGYTPGVEGIKKLLRTLSKNQILPPSGPNHEREKAFQSSWKRRIWLILAIIELIWLYGVWIRWKIWRGNIVICDRYHWDTLIDFHLNFPQEQVQHWFLWQLLERFALFPHISWLMLIPVDEAMQRSLQKNEPYPNTREDLKRRYTFYENLMAFDWWHVVDGRLPADDLATIICREVKNRTGYSRLAS